MRYFLFLVLLGIISCENNTPQTSKDNNPITDYILPREGYSEAVIVTHSGLKTIYVSGQVGEGDTFDEQFNDALDKLLKTLEKSGANFSDVVKYTTYVVDYQPEYLDTFRTIRKDRLGKVNMPASTLVGVQALGLPTWGVEIEAVAVITVP
jgi:enamine deaminase RidA (YjgF/YER057c/UK114 family)